MKPSNILAPSPHASPAQLRRARQAALIAAAFTCVCALLPPAVLAQASPKVISNGRVVVRTAPAPTLPSSPSSTSTGTAPALVDELARLRREMAERVTQIERVRLLDPALGAQLQTSLADLNARIKNAEIALARADERERDRRETDKLKLIQDHELRMVDKQLRNQKELMQYQQELLRVPEVAPAEKDFLELLADGLDANAKIQSGVRQLQSPDTAVQADGVRKLNGALRQASTTR